MHAARSAGGRNAPHDMQEQIGRLHLESHQAGFDILPIEPPPPGVRVRVERAESDGQSVMNGSVTVTGGLRECAFTVAPDGTITLDFVADTSAVLVADVNRAGHGDRIAGARGALVTDGLVLKEGIDAAREAALRWCQFAPNKQLSDDGRFEIEMVNGPLLTVRDLWTHEEVKGLANQYSAQQWCRSRLEGCRTMSWGATGPENRGNGRGDTFDIYETCKGWRAIDYRFPTGSHRSESLRTSPELPTKDEAKRWCAIRALCVLEGPSTDYLTLRYEPPVPF